MTTAIIGRTNDESPWEQPLSVYGPAPFVVTDNQLDRAPYTDRDGFEDDVMDALDPGDLDEMEYTALVDAVVNVFIAFADWTNGTWKGTDVPLLLDNVDEDDFWTIVSDMDEDVFWFDVSPEGSAVRWRRPATLSAATRT